MDTSHICVYHYNLKLNFILYVNIYILSNMLFKHFTLELKRTQVDCSIFKEEKNDWRWLAMIFCFGIKMHEMIDWETNVIYDVPMEVRVPRSTWGCAPAWSASPAPSFQSNGRATRGWLAVNVYVVCLFLYVKSSFVWLIIRDGGFDHLRKECMWGRNSICRTLFYWELPSLHVSSTIYIWWWYDIK